MANAIPFYQNVSSSYTASNTTYYIPILVSFLKFITLLLLLGNYIILPNKVEKVRVIILKIIALLTRFKAADLISTVSSGFFRILNLISIVY